MSCRGIERRIFVVGVPRSGTTLVQSLLAAHSEITSFPESHFFSRNFKRLGVVGKSILIRDPGPRLHEFLVEAEVESVAAAAFEEALRKLVPNRRFLLFRTHQVASQLMQILDELTLMRGKSNWIEKTPMHLHHLSMIERISSPRYETHFVHMIRDGLEVVSSLHLASQSWERAYDLPTCIARWNNDMKISLRRIREPNDHFVDYEGLTSQPASTMERLLNELGLAWEPGILQGYADASEHLVMPTETWKSNIGREIHHSTASAAELTPAQRTRVIDSLQHRLYAQVLQRAGIERSV